MGFLGIGSSDRKKSALKQAGEISGLRGEIGKFRDTLGTQRAAVGGYRTGSVMPFRSNLEAIRTGARPDVDLQRSTYRGMIEDPSKRGFGEDALAKMHGRAADVQTGNRTGFMRDLGKQIASSGMANTGAGVKSLLQYDTSGEKNRLSNARDIDIENAMAGKSDLWNSLSGLDRVQSGEDAWNQNNLNMQRDVLGMEGDTYGMEADILGREQGTYDQQLDTFGPEAGAYGEAYKPGFWGKMGDSFSRSLGSGLAGLATGGLASFGEGMGRDAAAGGGGGGSIPGPYGSIRTGGYSPRLSGRSVAAR